jgi:hypothetical protein
MVEVEDVAAQTDFAAERSQRAPRMHFPMANLTDFEAEKI